MGASLAVLLANVWIKMFETSKQQQDISEIFSDSYQNVNRKDSNQRAKIREKEVEYVICKNLFMRNAKNYQ